MPSVADCLLLLFGNLAFKLNSGADLGSGALEFHGSPRPSYATLLIIFINSFRFVEHVKNNWQSKLRFYEDILREQFYI